MLRLAVGLLVFLGPISLACADSPDPLDLISDKADLCVKLERPRALFELILTHPLFKQFQSLGSVRELYDSTNFRRFGQLVAYFEKELGAGHREIIDQLAGCGIAYSLEFAAQPPQLLVIQGQNEPMLRRFVGLASQILEQELARQEAKERLEKGEYRHVGTMGIGQDFHAAIAGTALLISNREVVLHNALDLFLDKSNQTLGHTATVAEAHKLAGADSIAWMWLNLDKIHKAPEAKDLFRLPRDNGALTVLFGGIFDVASRSPYIASGLHVRDDGFLLSVQLPRGREGMPEALSVIVPQRDRPGSRPLLEPSGVLFSGSSFVDLPSLWEKRAKLFNEKQAKALEQLDQHPPPFLPASLLDKLLSQAGAYHRLVVVHQTKSGYRVAPGQKLPSFALVTELRDPAGFSKKIEAMLGLAAFAAMTQVKMQKVEEKHGDLVIIGYRFPEDGKFARDVNDIRFNFTPCFVTAGNQFIASSNIELCRELVDLLKKEESKADSSVGTAPFRERFYAAGGAQLLEYYRDRLFTQTILDQAIPPGQATAQVDALIEFVRKLGILEIQDSYQEKTLRLDIGLRLQSTWVEEKSRASRDTNSAPRQEGERSGRSPAHD
jgi:hypothetical protein